MKLVGNSMRFPFAAACALTLCWAGHTRADEHAASASSPAPDKIIDVAPVAEATPEQPWDGDKPFLPDVREAQSAIPAQTVPVELLEALRPAARNAFNLVDVTVQERRMTVVDGETRIAVRLDNIERTIRLQPFTQRSPQARLLVQNAAGLLVETPWPEPATYRGSVDGMDAEVAASIRAGKVSMLVLPRDPAQPTWHMQPLSDALVGMPENLHAVYRNTDVPPSDATCGNDGVFHSEHFAGPADAPLPPAPNLATRVQQRLPAETVEEGGVDSLLVANIRCEIAYDTDVEFYQANGSSTLNTIYDIELIMNQVGLIYQAQVAISYTEMGIIVRTAEPDPYNSTNATTLLCEMRNWWNANGPLWRDVAHLFTGKDLDGITIGLATVSGICNGTANLNGCTGVNHNDYGLVQSRFTTNFVQRVGLSAHELGHNWSCCHCDLTTCVNPADPNCGIMNSTSNSSLNFETFSRNRITSYRDGRPCLDVWQNPTFVNVAYNGPETGSAAQPWNTMREGVNAAVVGGEVWAQAGNYFENLNIFKILNITAQNGTVRIGN